jgi:hypothetical protein
MKIYNNWLAQVDRAWPRLEVEQSEEWGEMRSEYQQLAGLIARNDDETSGAADY